MLGLRWTRRVVAAATSVAFALPLSAVLTTTSLETAQAQPDRILGRRDTRLTTTDLLRVPLLHGGRFTPSRVILVGPDATYIAAAPRRAPIRDGNRIDIGGLPLIGILGYERPKRAYVEPQLEIGPAYRVGDAVVVAAEGPLAIRDLRKGGRVPVSMIVKRGFGGGLGVAEFTTRFETAEPRALSGGEPIGSAYLTGDGVLISPPRSALSGFDFQ